MSAFNTELFNNFTDLNESIEIKSTRKINGCKKGLGKDQDLVYFGKGDNYHWGALFDCHGGNIFKYVLQKQNWDEIMKFERPDIELIRLIKLEPFQYGNTSGSTMSMMKIFENRIETFNIGDSNTIIFKNGSFIYMNLPHNRSNPVEKERLEKMNVIFEPTPNITYLLDSKTMGFKTGEYCIFEDGTRLAPSQALGHNHVTGYEVEFHTETFESTDEIRCICGSDGLFEMILFESENNQDVLHDFSDMINMSADELLIKSENRWKQTWDICTDINDKGIKQTSYYPENMYDDISVIVFDKSI